MTEPMEQKILAPQQPIPVNMHGVRTEAIVRGIYRGLLKRDPEPAALTYWSNAIISSSNPGSVLNAIVESEEFKSSLGFDSTKIETEHALASMTRPILENCPIVIVDVGAQELEGEQHVYADIGNHQLPYQIIGFEPLEEKINESKQRNPDPRITLFPTFIGDGNSHTFHINNYDATSSLLPLNHRLNSNLVDLSPLSTVKTEQVATSTLDRALSNTPRIDFLKLDIQGFELAALQHASAVLERTNVVHCEVSFMEIYQGQALFSEVETFLRQHGFYFLDFSSNCHYPYHCQSKNASRDRLGWSDAVFFKRTELLKTDRDLLAQVLIAMLVYQKPSLAEFLAKRYDAATGARLVDIFCATPL